MPASPSGSAALSPLALFSFIASGHNDALMVGLLVAGVTLAIEGRLAVGVALCALAALIKLPAAVAIVFLAVVEFQAATGAGRWRVVLKAVLVPCVVVVGGTLVAGYGWTWLGPTALHVPTELRVLATPAVSLGVFFHAIVHGIGVPVSTSVVVSATQVVCGLVVVAGTLWLVWNAHRLDVVRAIGLALVLVVVGSPTCGRGTSPGGSRCWPPRPPSGRGCWPRWPAWPCWWWGPVARRC